MSCEFDRALTAALIKANAAGITPVTKQADQAWLEAQRLAYLMAARK